VLGTGVVLAALGLAIPASAHVKVSGVDAVQGGSGVVTFRVPSESATASTTELLITFPSNPPFTSVETQPKPGWTATVVHKPLAKPVTDDDGDVITQYVSQVDFKATSPASAIPPGQFDMFNLSVGPFPKAPSVSFDALQSYSDGTNVNWDEKSADGAAEPQHPAPVLQLTPETPATAPAPSTSSSSGWTGVAALVVGIVALLVSVTTLATTRARRKTSSGA
jgi:uncharacterized protein